MPSLSVAFSDFISNWTGKNLVCPRTCSRASELQMSGFYFHRSFSLKESLLDFSTVHPLIRDTGR